MSYKNRNFEVSLNKNKSYTKFSFDMAFYILLKTSPKQENIIIS